MSSSPTSSASPQSPFSELSVETSDPATVFRGWSTPDPPPLPLSTGVEEGPITTRTWKPTLLALHQLNQNQRDRLSGAIQTIILFHNRPHTPESPDFLADLTSVGDEGDELDTLMATYFPDNLILTPGQQEIVLDVVTKTACIGRLHSMRMAHIAGLESAGALAGESPPFNLTELQRTLPNESNYSDRISWCPDQEFLSSAVEKVGIRAIQVMAADHDASLLGKQIVERLRRGLRVTPEEVSAVFHMGAWVKGQWTLLSRGGYAPNHNGTFELSTGKPHEDENCYSFIGED